MSDRQGTTDAPDPDRRRTFTGVVLVEAITIVVLWWFSRHFGT